MTARIIATFIFFLLIKLSAYSQDSLNNKQTPNTIYYQKGLKFTINNERLSIDDSIKTYLSKNAKALYEYYQFKKYEHWSNVCVYVWLTTWITAATQIGHNNHLALNLGLEGLIPLIVNPFYRKSIRHLKKGICYYNQQYGW